MQFYSDASYGRNIDLTSQVGYIIFLSDKCDKFQPLYWSSHKAKQVTRSVLRNVMMAFSNAFDMAFSIKVEFEIIINQCIPIVMVIDSLSFFM